MIIVDTSYVDVETLRAFETGIFNAQFKIPEGHKVIVTILPSNFRAIKYMQM